MKSSTIKIILWLNHILIILFMSLNTNQGQTNIETTLPFLISSFLLIDITYISSCNIRDNKIISLFCGLLALDSWYILLSSEYGVIQSFIFIALSPIIWYVSICFILMFLFQGGGYKFRKSAHILLFITCIGSLIGICISSRVYAVLYGLQFLAILVCLLIIIIYHRKRISFVLKNEWQSILVSFVLVTIAFVGYYTATINVQNHIANFGIYLPVLLFFLSIHGIFLKEHNSYPFSTVFGKRQSILIVCVSLVLLGLVTLFTSCGSIGFLMMVNIMFALIYLCNTILEINLKRGKNNIIRESKYKAALQHLNQAEMLKAEFANFLHDDVLQDLLSVKNMMTKAHRPDVQNIILGTLDTLNTHIREQMQDYHPVLLKNLTAKENYQNLIEAVSQSFHQKSMIVSFDCSEDLFLVEPYRILIYRLLKELLTNVFKHSNGDRAWIMLKQQNSIIELSVSDNGTQKINNINLTDTTKHKGITSITEQVTTMGGAIFITDNMPHGISIQITLPMKGDVSYQYFIS